MSIELKHARSAKWNEGVLSNRFEISHINPIWSCSSEFLADPNVQLTIGYLERHKDGKILEQLFIENEEQVMMNYFDVENENLNVLQFIICYFQNEYALLLSEKFRKDRGLTLPKNISYSIKK